MRMRKYFLDFFFIFSFWGFLKQNMNLIFYCKVYKYQHHFFFNVSYFKVGARNNVL